MEVQSDFEDVENSEFDYFFSENFRFKASQLYLSVRNRGRTTRRSENIEANVENSLKKP